MVFVWCLDLLHHTCYTLYTLPLLFGDANSGCTSTCLPSGPFWQEIPCFWGLNLWPSQNQTYPMIRHGCSTWYQKPHRNGIVHQAAVLLGIGDDLFRLLLCLRAINETRHLTYPRVSETKSRWIMMIIWFIHTYICIYTVSSWKCYTLASS